jgi:glyoxylase-like metal-dependent hydrolase (beta-lactamase superfamily II)
MLWKTALGRFTIYGIEDGWSLRDPMDFMPDSDPAVWEAHPEFLTDGKIRVSFGCFLVDTPTGLVMVDAGVGWSPDRAEVVTGRMPSMLQALGVRPEEIGTVLHTHLHMDHIGGDLDRSGDPFFPNARLYVHSRELDYWMTLDGQRGDLVRRVIEPFDARVETVGGDRGIVPGIAMVETFGHTPGHMSVELRSEQQHAVITGDVTHHPLQASNTDWNVAFDLDKAVATATRRSLYHRLETEGGMLAAGHFPRPGFGSVHVDDGVRVFMPGSVTQL